jgi:hypothetical protein
VSVTTRHDSTGVWFAYRNADSAPVLACVSLSQLQGAGRLYMPATLPDLRLCLPHKYQGVTTVQEALICLAWLDEVACDGCGQELWACVCACPLCGSDGSDLPANDCPECGRLCAGTLQLIDR